jgi:uncharacterized protein YbaR (Trm112 family)
MPSTNPPIDPVLLELLRCPHSGQSLRIASIAELDAINQKIEASACNDASGEPVALTAEAGLVSQDGQWFYAIRDAIPTLIPEEAIRLGSEA